jgi:hypothetical protein
MRKDVKTLLGTLAITAVVYGCHGAGMITEAYVNQKDASQVLELRTKETVKGMIGGRLVSPEGGFTLRTDQKLTAGQYRKVDSQQHPDGAEPYAYVLNLDGNSEMKLWRLSGDASLRDDAGNIWKLERRSHEWRPDPEKTQMVLKRIH